MDTVELEIPSFSSILKTNNAVYRVKLKQFTAGVVTLNEQKMFTQGWSLVGAAHRTLWNIAKER